MFNLLCNARIYGQLYVVVSVLCPVIPTWNGYTIVSVNNEDDSGEWQARLERTKIRYECKGSYDPGVATAWGRTTSTARYRFADYDTNAKTAYCRNGQWIPPLVPCIGTRFLPSDASWAPL